jgi:hypothetical protein
VRVYVLFDSSHCIFVKAEEDFGLWFVETLRPWASEHKSAVWGWNLVAHGPAEGWAGAPPLSSSGFNALLPDEAPKFRGAG